MDELPIEDSGSSSTDLPSVTKSAFANPKSNGKRTSSLGKEYDHQRRRQRHPEALAKVVL